MEMITQEVMGAWQCSLQKRWFILFKVRQYLWYSLFSDYNTGCALVSRYGQNK